MIVYYFGNVCNIINKLNICIKSTRIRCNLICTRCFTRCNLAGVWLKTSTNKVEVALKILNKKPADIDLFITEV